MSDDDTSSLIFWIAAVAIVFVALFMVAQCHEQQKQACRDRGGRVAEVRGEWFKWVCVEPEPKGRPQ